MPLFPVSQAKQAGLARQMESFGIHEQDLVERFIRGGGAGGQKINKTSSCVYLLHKPTGIEIKCQKSRSQGLNRFLARRLLTDEIRRRIQGAASREQQKREKIRRQKRRRSRRAKQKMLAEKKGEQIKRKHREIPWNEYY